ncbi:hypothetical protein [Stutzerimonas stutzeri]|uniref:hypothetical protein n=1 Tax=Stutzerimonas stutzeri TaxID=316 RepID=UPI000F7A529A|nr:hypothetical protein [Stutzerimonas stutzeri]MCP3432124.1 hypothetical protein [Stutzerimonas stutzeri]RRV63032.1 hypothetical protein EGJ08_02585 [Stutzerimonas stutzeri]RTM23973.1 hypothetical protein EKN22_07975 [Stutzerimonas stutzeri]
MITKILLIALFTWLALSKAQDLLLRWRLKRAGDPDVEIVVAANSRWNQFINQTFGFFRFVIAAAAVMFIASIALLGLFSL